MPQSNPQSKALTPEKLKALAGIAQIAVTDDEATSLAADLTSVLEEVWELGEIAAHDITPMVSPLQQRNIVRPDDPLGILTQEQALANAPEKESGMFRVSSILGGEQ